MSKKQRRKSRKVVWVFSRYVWRGDVLYCVEVGYGASGWQVGTRYVREEL